MKPFFVFSGQGAQFVGMGKDLAEGSAVAGKYFAEADRILGYELSKIIFEGPEEELVRSSNCQVAIYTVSCAAYAAFCERYSQVKPLAVAGLSLGEYGALTAGGVFDFAEGLKLVRKRALLMDEACTQTNGGMATVLNGDIEVIREVCAACGIEVANYNSPTQVVISGEKSKVETAVAELKNRGLRKVILLTVAGAFHSSLMKEAGEGLALVLADTPIKMPAIPAYHNFTAAQASSEAEIRDLLKAQVAGSVRWDECVKNIIRDTGADTMIEFGPGAVLTGLAKRAVPEITTYNVNSLATLDEFAAKFGC